MFPLYSFILLYLKLLCAGLRLLCKYISFHLFNISLIVFILVREFVKFLKSILVEKLKLSTVLYNQLKYCSLSANVAVL